MEVRDKDGKLVGYFFSEQEYLRLQYDQAWEVFDLQRQLDEAKGVKRTYDGTNGMTTAEALAMLERLSREAQEKK